VPVTLRTMPLRTVTGRAATLVPAALGPVTGGTTVLPAAPTLGPVTRGAPALVATTRGPATLVATALRSIALRTVALVATAVVT
jgi:hypothetical protein